jgi:putative hydrolase of the HAD superfamily/5'-nucleotidase
MQYKYILFDADETLFTFDNFLGIKNTLSKYKQTFSKTDYDIYQKYNKQLWLQYQNHEIDAEYLQTERFELLAKQVGVSSQQLNDEFLDAMADICVPLPGAVALLDALKDRATLGIITNGLARLQHKRIEHTGLEGRFACLVISEEFGPPKPNAAIFEHTFELLGNPDKSEILMVGDTLSSDIVGGHNAGIDTCWLQHPGVPIQEDIKPTFTVTNLRELQSLLLG